VTEQLETKREQIVQACARHRVARLDAFGSALRSDFRPGESDVDLLVEFAPMEGMERVEAYFSLLAELRQILGDRVDLVMQGAVKNSYIATEISRTKQQLYAA
jgi:predicted nucleotidyltransferase